MLERRAGWARRPRHATSGIDDVGFLGSLVALLTEEYDVPPARVFVVGFSNGGQMVIRLVMQVPELIAGAAVIGSNHPRPENVLPEVARLDRHEPVPVLAINGTGGPDRALRRRYRQPLGLRAARARCCPPPTPPGCSPRRNGTPAPGRPSR